MSSLTGALGRRAVRVPVPQSLFVVRQRGLGASAEIGELQRRVDGLSDLAVARHFEPHAAGHDTEGRILVESRLERHPRVKIPFLVLDPAGYALSLQDPGMVIVPVP